MHASLGWQTLRTGERVKALVVLGPDAEWADAIELAAALQRERPGRLVAYCDITQTAKRELLEHAQFRAVATLPNWVRAMEASPALDVIVLQAREAT